MKLGKTLKIYNQKLPITLSLSSSADGNMRIDGIYRVKLYEKG